MGESSLELQVAQGMDKSSSFQESLGGSLGEGEAVEMEEHTAETQGACLSVLLWSKARKGHSRTSNLRVISQASSCYCCEEHKL